MNYQRFYQALYEPLHTRLGPLDAATIVAPIGFDAGGPLNFCTFGRDRKNTVVTYVSCELAVREEQRTNSLGRYELLASCDSEDWVRSILSGIGRMSLDVSFDANHTMDIGGLVNHGTSQPPLQGVLFIDECRTTIDGQPFGVLRVVGITRPEMEFARSNGSAQLVQMLIKTCVYPHTLISRSSAV